MNRRKVKKPERQFWLMCVLTTQRQTVLRTSAVCSFAIPHFLLRVPIFSLLMVIGLLQSARSESLTYERDIRPIFRAHCFDCHGATEEMEGGLDLRLVRFMKRGGESGPSIVAGQPDESYLLDRIVSGEMPPGETRLSADEIRTLTRWISDGAVTARPEPESIGLGLGITPEERSFWSFQPIRRPEVSPPKDAVDRHRVRSSIDALILRNQQVAAHGSNGQETESQVFAPDADRRTLVLRAHFTLTGLPPTNHEMERWLKSSEPDWFDQLVSELLDSPHYGERWARHWLDVAGYADSEGYTVADAERPWAWKYRDWVIRSLNADKPFDRFLTEQLAGDELAGPVDGDLTDEQIELLTATGFLRMAADGTGSGANTAEGRNQVMADTLKIVSTSLMGLSLQCAQCHDHRYDPIPQADYYALRAVFEPALDWQSWKVPNARRVSLYTAADRKLAAEIEAVVQTISAEKSKKQAEYMEQALEQELAKFEPPLRDELRESYKTPADKRTDRQKKLLKSHPSVNISPGVLYQYLPKAAEELKKFDQQIKEKRAEKPVEEFLRVLVEPAGHQPVTKLFHRGDHQQPKHEVHPAALSVVSPPDNPLVFPLNDESLPTTGRRLAFARWLTGSKNPLFARVIVNRVWMHHFGKGLVSTPADFGKLGTEPSNPQLLDWLADEFTTSGWSLKHLHQVIMSSTAWRQRYAPNAPHRNHLMRLEAETIRDRMLAASGRLERELFGQPLKIKEDDTGQTIVDGVQTRRSLYIQARRSRPVAMLQTFDAPVMETNCEVRSHATVATQSLMLLNGQFTLGQAGLLADRAAREARPLNKEHSAAVLDMPAPRRGQWTYGLGHFNGDSNCTQGFERLEHWTGTQWQAGEKLPDADRGWVLLNANGGHPDVSQRAVVRRWTAASNGTVHIQGSLSHGSAAGDGVRGRVVSSRAGLLGEWSVHNGQAATSVKPFKVVAGDTIDFITDCRQSVTSDSFGWPVSIEEVNEGKSTFLASSTSQFSGPVESIEALLGQVVAAWQFAYCREPTVEELMLAGAFIVRHMETLATSPNAIPAKKTAARQALTNLCHSLLSSNEFLYVE